jgi:hypothetical protein
MCTRYYGYTVMSFFFLEIDGNISYIKYVMVALPYFSYNFSCYGGKNATTANVCLFEV